MRYLPVNVLVHADGMNCTNNGITVTHTKKLVIEHNQGHLTQEDIDDHGYVVLELVKRNINGTEYLSYKRKGEASWVMFGGNFVSSSDSRFSDVNHYPIPVHDRIES